MEIGPINEGKPALSEQVEREKSGEAAGTAERQGDDVKISAEGQRFLAGDSHKDVNATTEGNQAEDNTIRHQNRLDQVRDRIESGYYDQEVVRDMMVERMIDDMLEDINSFYK